VALLAVLIVALLLIGGVVALLNHWQDNSPHRVAVAEHCVASTDAGVATLAPDQAANAALIAAVGQARGLSPRAVTIALATAMQESKLRNLDYGDRDSLGLFQQRPSQDWGTPEQIMDPLYSAGEFYSALVRVDGYESMPITEAAQAVQRSAFPEAYAKHENAARSFASALTGYSPGALTCTFAPAAERLTPQNLLGVFRAEWGDWLADQASIEEPDPVSPVNGGLARLAGADQTQVWAVAEWAVAKASQLGIRSVTVGDQTWDRATGSWSTDQPVGSDGSDPSATGGTDTAAAVGAGAPTAVIVVLA
jgi:hypothetical protein